MPISCGRLEAYILEAYINEPLPEPETKPGILLRITPMSLARPGTSAAAVTATNPAKSANSIKSWPCLSFQIPDCGAALEPLFT